MLSSLPVLNCTVAANESSSDNALNSRVHPLCVEEVLSALFKYFTFSELKQFRRVCRAWEKEARHAISTETRKWKLAPLVLNREWGNNISRYLDVVGRQEFFFYFTKLHLVGIVYDPRKSTVKTSKLIRLLSICGPRITNLQLKYIVIKGKFADFVTFFNLLQELCPNIEKLALQNVFTVKETVPEHCRPKVIRTETINVYEKLTVLQITAPVFSNRDDFEQQWFDMYMRHLFKLAPNLEKLKYYDRKGNSIRHLDPIINSIKEGNLSKLHTLVMDTCRGDIHDVKQLDILRRLEIRSLRIGVDSSNLIPETTKQRFGDFLESQSTSLNALKICYNFVDMFKWEDFFSPTYIFPNLSELNIPFQNFTFGILKLTPNLRKLVLRKNAKSICWIEESTDTDNSDTTLEATLRNWTAETKCSPTCNNIVTELKCEFIVDEPTMQLLAQKFRKLAKLEFGFLNEDVLLVVYEHFADLKSLAVACPPAMYVSSRAYLGESKNIALTESRRAGFKLEVDSHSRVAEQIRTSQTPSILWLKGLQRLELKRFGPINTMNRTHHSIECSSGFMFGVSALQNVTELKLHPFIHKRAVMSLQLMPALKRLWTVPLIIGSREGGGRKNFPTTAYWYQVLLRKRPDLKIYVTTSPTQKEQDNGNFETGTRLLQVNDVYRGNATTSGLFVYLDEYYIYQDGCEVLRDASPERRDSLLPCLMT